MKKLLLSVTLVATALFSFAQTPQVPNGDFENWEESICESEIPTDYESLALQIYNQTKTCPPSVGVTKSTNKYSGTYAIELSSTTFMGELAGNLFAISDEFIGRPTKLVGYTKFTKGGTDELGIFVGLDGDNETEVAYGEFSVTETQSDYVKFEIILDYTDNTTPPTSMYIGFKLGTSVDEQLTSSANTKTLIDKLSFEYGPTTATTSFSATSSVNVFTTQKDINFSKEVSEVVIYNLVGLQELAQTATTKSVNAAALKSGLYVVTYKYNDAYFSKKVVIE